MKLSERIRDAVEFIIEGPAVLLFKLADEVAQLESDLAKTPRAMQAAIDAGTTALAENDDHKGKWLYVEELNKCLVAENEALKAELREERIRYLGELRGSGKINFQVWQEAVDETALLTGEQDETE